MLYQWNPPSVVRRFYPRPARMTVYSHFRNKHALFAAVVENQAAQLSKALANIPPAKESPAADTVEALCADLTKFDVGLMTFFANPETQAFNRVIESEARHHPALAEAFAAAGPRAVISRVARRLKSAMGLASLNARTRCARRASLPCCAVSK